MIPRNSPGTMLADSSRSRLAHRSLESCPGCGSNALELLYEVRPVPVHSVLLIPTQEAARSYPSGQIELVLCAGCGFIFNRSFDPSLHDYSEYYEETQGFSPTFSRFHRELAAHLVQRFDLRRKRILEIGCGKGEFLSLLCQLGNNRGIGFDPAYVPERGDPRLRDRITFIRDFFHEKYAGLPADFICCKMTLEHIRDVAEFVRLLRRCIQPGEQPLVFFQVPDVDRILQEFAFWDVYYEHCSYFSSGSLARLFESCGFEVLEMSRWYGDQYLVLYAQPREPASPKPESSLKDLLLRARRFSPGSRLLRKRWKSELQHWKRQSKRIVLWGGGSKAVAFLTTLNVEDEINCVVDVNPYRQGTFLAGSGHAIVPPEFLQEVRPHLVIAMNPIYRREIGLQLEKMGLDSRLLSVTCFSPERA